MGCGWPAMAFPAMFILLILSRLYIRHFGRALCYIFEAGFDLSKTMTPASICSETPYVQSVLLLVLPPRDFERGAVT
jgi:hypothetical protein